jgi:hypothetical protein
MDRRLVLVFERSKAGLKKLSSFLSEQTSSSSAFLNVMRLLNYVLNTGQSVNITNWKGSDDGTICSIPVRMESLSKTNNKQDSGQPVCGSRLQSGMSPT